MKRLMLLLICSSILLGFGCTRPSYINVPADGGDTAINGPNWDTTVKIEKAAIAYLLSKDPLPGDVVLRLPEGTADKTAFALAADLSAFNVFPEGQAPSDEYQLVEVRKIVARGTRGRVDLIRPGKLRERELVEVHMDYSLWDGWTADYLRVRNIDVDRLDPLLLAPPAAKPKKPAFEEVTPDETPAEDAAE